MGEIAQGKLADKMFLKYQYILTHQDCIDLAEDILNLVSEENGYKYQKPLLEWLHGKLLFTDIVYNGFSLVNLAKWLDADCPNIPIAALLLMLEEEGGKYRAISAVAGEWCVADPRIVQGEVCTTVGKYNGAWYFMLEDSSPDNLQEYQCWQVLLLNPALTIQVAYEHPDGTMMFLDENGVYTIVPPKGDV